MTTSARTYTMLRDTIPAAVDEILLRNVGKAHRWFALIKSGRYFADIASAENTSKRRVQQVINLAFLAPDAVRYVLNGAQPIGFISDWYRHHTLPSDWNDQRGLINALSVLADRPSPDEPNLTEPIGHGIR